MCLLWEQEHPPIRIFDAGPSGRSLEARVDSSVLVSLPQLRRSVRGSCRSRHGQRLATERIGTATADPVQASG